MTKPTNWHGPCEAQLDATDVARPHVSWDLDLGDVTAWMRAAETCRGCPLLTACQELRREFYGASNPSGVIWAGVAYSQTGRPLDTAGLRRLASLRRNKKTREARRRARSDPFTSPRNRCLISEIVGSGVSHTSKPHVLLA